MTTKSNNSLNPSGIGMSLIVILDGRRVLAGQLNHRLLRYIAIFLPRRNLTTHSTGARDSISFRLFLCSVACVLLARARLIRALGGYLNPIF